MQLGMPSHEEDAFQKIYYFQAYGLSIESMVASSKLLDRPQDPDVIVHYGDVPEMLDDPEVCSDGYQQNAEAILLKVKSIANYLIIQGKKIVIQRAPGSHDDEVRLFLFGSAFGALLHQRGLLPLHGSAIEVHGGAVIFVGPSGHGKSTLAGAFHQRGYRIIADDVCAVSTANGRPPLVYPGFPCLKLWPDTLEKLGKNPEEFHKITPMETKRRLPLDTGFCAIPLPLLRIYELSTTDTLEFKLTPLHGMDKLGTIIEHTYRLEFLAGTDRKKVHFLQCAAAIRHAAVSRATRPRVPLLLDELADLLEQDWAPTVGDKDKNASDRNGL